MYYKVAIPYSMRLLVALPSCKVKSLCIYLENFPRCEKKVTNEIVQKISIWYEKYVEHMTELYA